MQTFHIISRAEIGIMPLSLKPVEKLKIMVWGAPSVEYPNE